MTYLLLFILAILPQKSGYVHDFTGKLSNHILENDLARFQKEEGVQLVVIIVSDLGGRPIKDVSQDYFARWQIGHNGRDRGILVLLSLQDKSSYIDLGYGLEDSITESVALDISEKVINPLLAKQDVDAATRAAVKSIFSIFGFGAEGVGSLSIFRNHALWIFLASIPLLYLVARFAPTRFFFLSPTIGFALGYTQSLGLGIVIASLGLVMVTLSYILKKGVHRR